MNFAIIKHFFTPRALVILLLLAWYAFFLVRPVTFMRADIGRHVKNGEILLATPIKAWAPILKTNFYSYTNAAAPFINHHWGSGIIFYLVWRLGGWTLLSLFSIALYLATFLIFFFLAERVSSWRAASVASAWLVPLIAERTEIRPEIFSAILIGIFLLILTRYRDKRAGNIAIFILPAIQILWVNFHIYFILGLIVVGAFWLEALWGVKRDPKYFKMLTAVLAATIVASALNPAGLTGLLYPFRIFGNYGVPVEENRPVLGLIRQSPGYVNYWIFLISAAVGVIGWFTLRAKLKTVSRLPETLLAIFFMFLALRSARNLSLFALVILPALAAIIYSLFFGTSKDGTRRRWAMVGTGILVMISFIINLPRASLVIKDWYLGLASGLPGAADFITQNNIKGPLFNDFDSGSYAIYYLYPALKPFADNRPEAYPAEFFQTTYVNLHTDPKAWEEAQQTYGFNAILYSFDDKAPFALPFIINRLLDPSWAPVYTDKFAIVFLKRNEQNAELIKKYEIPKEKFSLQKVE